EVRHLDRGGGDVRLADHAREGLAGEPRLLEPALLPRGARDRARILVVEPDAGREAEAEVVRPLCHQVDAEALAHLVEVDVARLDDRLVEGDRAVPLLLPPLAILLPQLHPAA